MDKVRSRKHLWIEWSGSDAIEWLWLCIKDAEIRIDHDQYGRLWKDLVEREYDQFGACPILKCA